MLTKTTFYRPASLALVGGLVAGACSPPPTVQETNGVRLEELIERYVELQRGGRGVGGAEALSAQAFLEEIETDRRLLGEVGSVGTEGLSREQDIDRRLMIGLLESSIRSAATRRRWENEAALYVPSGPIGLLLGPEAAGSPEERAEDLTTLLSEIPGRLQHGRDNLGRPPRRFTDAAVFQTESTLEQMRTGIPALDEVVEADLEAAAESATTALESYLRFLRDELLPRSDGDWAIGREEYDFILQRRWYLDTDADDVLERGLRSFEETEALAQEVAGRMAPGADWVEVYERLKDDHPAADSIKQAYQEQMDAARAFVIQNRIVTLPEGEYVITVDTPPAMRRSSPFGTFQAVGAFDDGLEGRLVLTPIEDWMSPEQQAERLRSHHRAWIPIIAVHEAYPGHHVQALKLRENPRILRKVVREPIFSEGWGLFTEELMFELGFLQGDDVRLTQLRNRLWRAARVILDVSLHTGRMTFDEAVDFLVEKVRFERYAAELEVGMYTRRPTYVLGYLIGMQEIERIRADYVERFGEPSPPSEFYDRLLSVGSIPPALVREELLGR
jgi:uncharacterized protein (DUF885 family)